MISMVLVIAGSFVLLATLLARLAAWVVLQRAEEGLPRVQELAFNDKTFVFDGFLFVLFTLLSYSLALISPDSVILIGWMILFAIILVLFILFTRRLYRYSHALFLLERMRKECLKSVAKGDEQKALEWLDVVIETAFRAVTQGSMHTARTALKELLTIIEGYVATSVKRQQSHAVEAANISLLDHVQYLVIHVATRLEWLYKKALIEDMDPVAEEVVTLFAKISLYFAKYHPSLAHLPLLFIQKSAMHALEGGYEEIAVRAGATLSELAKNCIALSKERQESCKAVVISILNHLEEIVSQLFKKNKEVNPALLMQPFAEIGELLGHEEFKDALDREEILNELKRLLAKYNALDLVMQKRPVSE